MNIYLVGSLKHPKVREVADHLREAGHEVFDDWHAGGPEADQHWRFYEQDRGRNYVEALAAPFAVNAFDFDRRHLDLCDVAIAVCKPGKMPGISSVAELTYVRWGRGKRTLVLFDGEPEQWDLMLPLTAHRFCYTIDELVENLA